MAKDSFVTLTVEELATFYVEHSENRHVSEITRIDRIGDDVTIKFVTRELVLEALAFAEKDLYGDKKAYIVSLIEHDLEENFPEEVDNGELPTERETVVDRYDSPTYGDLQSPAAETLRGSGYGSQSSEDIQDTVRKLDKHFEDKL